jgi:hypothetical protein
MRRHFPSARVVTQAEADPLVEDWLARRGLVRLIEARRLSPFMLKLTDFRVLGGGANLLTLDSDIIFFRRPSELLVADDGPLPVSLFQRDPASTYNLSEERARNELGVDLAPQINTGITLFPPESLDLTRCESYLAHPEVARITGWMEQTLHALCASDQGRVAYLPDSYLISLERHADPTSLVARHYAGPSRSLLTEEGMTELTAIGFFSEIGAGRNLETLSAQPSGESC